MGCAQTSQSVIPINHIPIERLYDNGDYPVMKPEPVVIITAPPAPSYVKSALKKTHPDGKGRSEKLSVLKRKQPPINKSVNFDEQVLVKSRTPTPSKTWYEKASSTMPMRKHRRNDGDDYDYDDEEIASISSDEEQENNEQIDTESQIPRVRPPTPPLQRNRADPSWYNTNTAGFMPPMNTMLENEYFPPTTQQSSFNTNTYATENPMASPGNRIKVRRRLTPFGPPQISPTPSYQSPSQTSIIPPYQSPAQTSTIPPYQSLTQTSIIPPYQSPVQPSSQTVQVKQTLPNTNSLLIEHRPTLTNGESS